MLEVVLQKEGSLVCAFPCEPTWRCSCGGVGRGCTKATEPARREPRLMSPRPRHAAGRSPALSIRFLLHSVRSLNRLKSASRSFCRSGVRTGQFLPPALAPCRLTWYSFSPVGLCFPPHKMGLARPRTPVLSDLREVARRVAAGRDSAGHPRCALFSLSFSHLRHLSS